MEPEIRSLSYKKRQGFFFTLLFIFLVTLPVFIFYSSGYRLSFENEETSIVTTGGIYITADNLGVDVYLDEDKIDKPRLFRSAYYIQNIENGLHRLVVQGPGLHTWVKVLPVDSYIVTEAAAFNMPVLPHIRPIPDYVNVSGTGIYISQSTTSDMFPKATTTGNFVILKKAAPSSLLENSEFVYVEELFTTSAASSTSIINRLEEEIERFRFSSSTNASTSAIIEPVYVEQNNMRIVERGEDIFARWIGSGPSTPHYFCTPDQATSTVAFRYGAHIVMQMEEQRLSTTTPLHLERGRICRSEIRIDRKWQKIKYYEFFPRSSDLVVLQLEDGLYVTEIDDRAWQNTQMVYPGDKFETFVTDNNIYIKEDGRYFELMTKIDEVN